jgi:hypothetical protein
MTRQDDNIRKRIKSTEKFVPFIRLQQVTGWDGRRYRRFAIVRVLRLFVVIGRQDEENVLTISAKRV